MSARPISVVLLALLLFCFGPDTRGMSRTCRSCGSSDPSAFYQTGRYGNICKVCYNMQCRAQYSTRRDARRVQISEYQKAHLVEQRERFEKWRAKDPEAYRRYQHDHAQRTAQRRKELRDKRRIEAPEIWRTATKLWAQANREKQRAYKTNRRARELGAEGRFSAVDVHALYVKQSGLCAACSADLSTGFQCDHVVPVSRGGSNWPSNIQLLCAWCNRSKGAKLMEEWRGHADTLSA